MSEHTLAYFSRCFQSETTEKKTLAKTLIRADSRSLLLPIAATFLWWQILTGFLGLLSIALLSLQKLQISLTRHIRLISSYFFKSSVCKYYSPLGENGIACVEFSASITPSALYWNKYRSKINLSRPLLPDQAGRRRPGAGGGESSSHNSSSAFLCFFLVFVHLLSPTFFRQLVVVGGKGSAGALR